MLFFIHLLRRSIHHTSKVHHARHIFVFRHRRSPSTLSKWSPPHFLIDRYQPFLSKILDDRFYLQGDFVSVPPEAIKRPREDYARLQL